MSKPQSIESMKAEAAARKFAKSQGLSDNDPIVRTLAQGLKMRLGLARWRNGQRTENRQLGLWPTLRDENEPQG